jgi:hypothetical protein
VPFLIGYPQIRFFFTLQFKNANGEWCKRLGMVSTADELYRYEKDLRGWRKIFTFPSEVCATKAFDGQGNQVLILGGESGMYLYDGSESVVKIEGVNAVQRLSFFEGRVFWTRGTKELFYSAPFELMDFRDSIDGGGCVILPSLHGGIEAIVPMKNRLLLFFERGIFTLSGGGSARDFEVKEIGYSGGKIFGSSVGVCGAEKEQAIFLTENGLYSFDGNGVKRTCENLEFTPKREGQVCVHAQFDGVYYLSYQVTDYIKKMVVLDLESGLGYYSFSAIYTAVCGDLLLCGEGDILQRAVLGGELPSVAMARFFVEDLDFGVQGRKALKTVRFWGEGAVLVRVGNEKEWKSANLALGKQPVEMRLDLLGEAFRLEIYLQENGKIMAMEADLQYLKGNKEKNGYGY